MTDTLPGICLHLSPLTQTYDPFVALILFIILLPDMNTFTFSHCTACKILGGGEYSLNAIIPKENLKITKGELKEYRYKAASGKAYLSRFSENNHLSIFVICV